MKTCGACGATKPFDAFGKNKARKDGLQSQCKDCKSKSQRAWYQKNRARHIRNVNQRRDEKIAEAQRFLYDYYRTHPCVDCGEANPVVLEGDHVRGKKKAGLSRLVRDGESLKTLKAELTKCEVRCANCHRIKTAKEQGWYCWKFQQAG